MASAKSPIDLLIEEARKVFDAHEEPVDRTMDKKLIINIAPGGSFIDRRHNPHLPVTTSEVAEDVSRAYEAGATMWHLHPRNPETGSIFMPLDKRLEIHRQWCDAVFKAAPEIIPNVGAIYVTPPKLEGSLIDQESILAQTRAAPVLEPLTTFGPRNRYVEVAVVLCHTAALGGTRFLSFNSREGIISDVKYLQSKGIRMELCPFKHSDLSDIKKWVIEPGLVEPPVIVDTLLGVHNSTPAPLGMPGFEMLFTYVRMLPKGVLWQALIGSRAWLPLTVAAIILGADIVRVGKEDAVYMYPHKDEYIKDSGRVVEAVASIARYLGREVATPSEARKILGLPPVS